MKELFLFLIGMATGCGIGYFVSSLLKVSKLRCILLGGVMGGLFGFFIVNQF